MRLKDLLLFRFLHKINTHIFHFLPTKNPMEQLNTSYSLQTYTRIFFLVYLTKILVLLVSIYKTYCYF